MHRRTRRAKDGTARALQAVDDLAAVGAALQPEDPLTVRAPAAAVTSTTQADFGQRRAAICRRVFDVVSEHIQAWPPDRKKAWEAYEPFLGFQGPVDPEIVIEFFHRLVEKRTAAGLRPEDSLTWEECSAACPDFVAQSVRLLGFKNDAGMGPEAVHALNALKPFFRVCKALNIPWRSVLSDVSEQLVNLDSMSAMGYGARAVAGAPVALADLWKSRNLRSLLRNFITVVVETAMVPSNLLMGLYAAVRDIVQGRTGFAHAFALNGLTVKERVFCIMRTWGAILIIMVLLYFLVLGLGPWVLAVGVAKPLLAFVQARAQDLWEDMKAALGKLWTWASKHGREVMDAVPGLAYVTSIFSHAAEKAKVYAQPLTSWLAAIGEKLKTAASAVKEFVMGHMAAMEINTYSQALFWIAAVKQFPLIHIGAPATAGGRSRMFRLSSRARHSRRRRVRQQTRGRRTGTRKSKLRVWPARSS